MANPVTPDGVDTPVEVFSTQVIIDFDLRNDGQWEVIARFDMEDQIAAWEVDELGSGEGGVPAPVNLPHELGDSIIEAVLGYYRHETHVPTEYESCINAARDLLCEQIRDPEGEANVEYTRGIVELIADAFGHRGVEMGERMEQVAAEIGVKL